MSKSVRPHRQQPTRLPLPWDSPGKNTGVGCHFLFQCRKVKSESEVAQSCPTLSDPMDCSLPGSSIHGICQARVLEWVAIAFSESNAAVYKSITQHTEVYAPYGAYQGNAKMADFGELISITYQVNRITEKYHVIISVSAKNHLIKSSMYL